MSIVAENNKAVNIIVYDSQVKCKKPIYGLQKGRGKGIIARPGLFLLTRYIRQCNKKNILLHWQRPHISLMQAFKFKAALFAAAA